MKKATMDTYWVPGVNNHGRYGRWAFAEFTDVYEMQSDFEVRVEDEVQQDDRLRCGRADRVKGPNMANKRTRKRSGKTVATITHGEASRKNIPTAEYQAVMEEDDRSPIQVAYERRNRDLDPSARLAWQGRQGAGPTS